MTTRAEMREQYKGILTFLAGVTSRPTHYIARQLGIDTDIARLRLRALEERGQVSPIRREGVKAISWKLRRD